MTKEQKGTAKAWPCTCIWTCRRLPAESRQAGVKTSSRRSPLCVLVLRSVELSQLMSICFCSVYLIMFFLFAIVGESAKMYVFPVDADHLVTMNGEEKCMALGTTA